VLLATIGPGVANAANTVANAHQDKVPLIFLTGCVDGALAHTYTHQVFDHQQLLRPIVKGSFRAEAGAVGAVIDKAIALAISGQPGPVHVDVPIGVAEGESDEMALPAPPVAAPALADVSAIAAALNKAERPLIIAGLDAVNTGAGDVLTKLALAGNIPVIATYKAKGLLGADAAALDLGGHGLSPKSDRTILPLIKASDCVILAGYDPIEMRVGWRFPFADNSAVVDISPVARDHGMHSPTHTLEGDVRGHIEALANAVTAHENWINGEPVSARVALAEAFATPAEWGPGQVFATLRDNLPEDTVITADSGAHRILLSQVWACRAPRQMLQSTALCTMACSVPIGAGYKLIAPDTPVCSFVGDGGMEMGLGELATLRDHKIPLIICVLVDESLTLIEMKQRGSQRANVGVDFSGSDFPAIAAAMGGHGVWVDDVDTLASEADVALSRDTFTVLACRIGRRAYDGTF
jgi:acetolactate synthase-1/2/3 large subunit